MITTTVLVGTPSDHFSKILTALDIKIKSSLREQTALSVKMLVLPCYMVQENDNERSDLVAGSEPFRNDLHIMLIMQVCAIKGNDTF